MKSKDKNKKSLKPAIIVHGGSWNIPDSLREGHISGVIKAVKIGYENLIDSKSALDAVENAVEYMEDDPIFDAGIGSFLNEEGFVELDALIMDGSTLEAGAVGAVTNCKNPIKLARKLLGNTFSPMMIVGKGADSFAEKTGLNCNPEILIIPRERKRWEENREGIDIFSLDGGSTVGAVAIDKEGNIASATSTGGSPIKMVGRLGDTSLIGCGGYACARAAASSTGHGESFMKLIAAKLATDLCEKYTPQDAAEIVIDRIANIGGKGGIIIVDKNSSIGYSFNTKRMAYALINSKGKLSYGIDPK